jgi:hypothetical protein
MAWRRDAQGAWWLYAGYGVGQFERVGCFPAGAYEPASGLSDHASVLQFGGEVASNGAGFGPMGSGIRPFPDWHDSYGQVAFQNEVSVLTDVQGSWEQADLSTPPQDNPGTYVPAQGTSGKWGSYFFFGGA